MATWVQTSQFSKVMDAIKEKLAKKLDASGIKNNLTTEDSGYVLDARAGKTLGDRATTLETKVGDLYFDTDSSGNWGFKPSKNGAVKSFTATGAASTIESSNLTASKALVSDANGKVAASSTTTTELGYLHGVTSSVQEQMNSLNSNLTSFQAGVDSLYDQISSLGVTPDGKTLANITAALQSLYNNAYNTGFTNGKASVTHTIQAVWSAGGGGSTILIKIDGTQVANNYKVDLPTSLYSSNAVSYTITG